MKRLVLVPVASLGFLLAGLVPSAPAQYYDPYPLRYSNPPGINPGGGPRLSPYLNFFRGNPAVDYYLGVVPEVDRRRNVLETRNEFLQLEGAMAAPPLTEAEFYTPRAQTGHGVAFMNTAGFFGGSGYGGRYPSGAVGYRPGGTPPSGRTPPGNVTPGVVK